MARHARMFLTSQLELPLVRWLPFVWASIVAAATAGFGYGTAAFAVSALGLEAGGWWPAMIQAHGHLQIFGWGGLMVLGVGFFFLPRLRGAPLAAPSILPWILGLMATGLGLRAIAQPILAVVGGPAPGGALAASGLFELAAATLAVGTLAATVRRGPPLRQRPGLAPVLPYLVAGFVALWLALAANAVLTFAAGSSLHPLVSLDGDNLVVQMGLAGFVVPISVAVSARSFPLFLWLRVPSRSALRLSLVPFLVGLALRLWGTLGGPVVGTLLGDLLEGAALIAFAVVLQVVPPRRREGLTPTEDRHYVKSVEYLLVPAYVWLVVAGLLDIASGIQIFALSLPISADMEIHALGSGFITLLILGMGQRMLPGFAGRRLASVGLVWATALLGNASAILRVGPLIGAAVAGWPSGPVESALALAGVFGLGAVGCFGLNLWRTFR